MLAPEVLWVRLVSIRDSCLTGLGKENIGLHVAATNKPRDAHPTNNVVMVCEVSLA